MRILLLETFVPPIKLVLPRSPVFVYIFNAIVIKLNSLIFIYTINCSNDSPDKSIDLWRWPYGIDDGLPVKKIWGRLYHYRSQRWNCEGIPCSCSSGKNITNI